MNKKYECHDKVISLQKLRTKQLHDNFVSLSNIYIHTYINLQTQSGDHAIIQYYKAQQPCTKTDCKYNQYAVLNLIMGYKQNDLVIVNTKNNKENMKIYIHTPWVWEDSLYVYVHTYTYIQHIY